MSLFEHYNPEKMVPKEALDQVWTCNHNPHAMKNYSFRERTAGERKTIKKYHTRKSRRKNNQIEIE